MKNLVIAAVLALSGTQAFAMDLVVCEGKIADQDVTLLDDGQVVGIIKGKVNVSLGGRGNRLPFEKFSDSEVVFEEGEGSCTLTAQSQKGSFTLEAPCTGEGAGKIKNLNIQSLGLISAELDVTCRQEEYGEN